MGIVYVGSYMDDNLRIDDVDAIDKAITALKKWAGIKSCGRAAALPVL